MEYLGAFTPWRRPDILLESLTRLVSVGFMMRVIVSIH